MSDLLTFTGAVERDDAIDRWLDAQPEPLGALARRWFVVMRDAGPDVRELLHDGLATVCVRDAAFAYVGAYRAHVNVGFFLGAELPDPVGLLVGSGKRMRHVKLAPGVEVDAAAVERLIAAAYSDIRARLGG